MSNNFEYGKEYVVRSTSGLSESFIVGDKLTYVGYDFSVRDGQYAYRFYNSENGMYHFQLVHELSQEFKKLKQNLAATGNGWPRSDTPITKASIENIDFSSKEKALAPFVSYFKSVLEGDKKAENWFIFFERYSNIFEKVCTRGEYLKWKSKPYTQIRIFLDMIGEQYNAHPRYGWLA